MVKKISFGLYLTITAVALLLGIYGFDGDGKRAIIFWIGGILYAMGERKEF